MWPRSGPSCLGFQPVDNPNYRRPKFSPLSATVRLDGRVNILAALKLSSSQLMD